MVRTFLVAGLLFCSLSEAAYSGQLKGSIEKKKEDIDAGQIQKIGRQKSIDLRPALAKLRSTNKLIQGKNLILETKAQGSTPGTKLYATVAKGRITKWQAVGSNGKNLTTTTQQSDNPSVSCKVCISIKIGNKTTVECYNIDCKDLPKPQANAR